MLWAVNAGPAVPVWLVAPFGLLLLAIAVLPLAAEHFWHKNRNKGLVAALFAVPVVGYCWLHGRDTFALVQHGLVEYLEFIVLLAALYVVAGGILVEGSWRASAPANTLVLAIGGVLANLIGTTGASMVLIRVFLRINQRRTHKGHLPVFFIFIVSNLGGLLTPLGDPPLFLGFLRGIDFFWTLCLWPEWLTCLGIVLTVFFVVDSRSLRREPTTLAVAAQPVRVRGLVNLLFLAGILMAVLLQCEDVAQPVTRFANRFFPCPSLRLDFPWPGIAMALMAVLSLALTPRGLRKANEFGWHAIIEVAVLFVGIFITMQPALQLVARRGGELGISEPWQFFWLTGLLSAGLDNAPTYVTFATLASGGAELETLQTAHGGQLLQAISCGAVFMGAMTYIGNGPNFMVKAIADHSGYRTPSFFGYLGWSISILVPIFVVITFLHFPP
jgi:Na+/H+ antiporter NhaD/arsenite permease-like protein